MRGNYNEAERLYAYLTDKLPRNAEVYEGRARMFLARGMRGFAQRDINLAFEYARGRLLRLSTACVPSFTRVWAMKRRQRKTESRQKHWNAKP